MKVTASSHGDRPVRVYFTVGMLVSNGHAAEQHQAANSLTVVAIGFPFGGKSIP
ncbi:hypothetical protein L829_3162 [Mycobacteroides abscessus MAB_030201_1075]|uniref:Uncharacterized protein n=1 Tax=Mycobacteroides abscessus MAB_030201_1075 TaxID=1335410 RepID=A0A829PQZ2_9MYCO|nr:hypothetical protein L835_0280 [Mycobacteroides abscessus MAB_110811_1470]ETZ89585.1 hypothetical protein L829_3162 [Mycobacteroides abscessus MAB_030201_1075]ETZ95207.1 hypothetical protein L828_0290 [Mycobacteroides abscessus MAB_030201_1061]SIH66178.1 Uncharacterised protein [Mycobacteroides abscessus subsp. abscessus]